MQSVEKTAGIKRTIIHTGVDGYYDGRKNFMYNGKPLFEYETTLNKLISDFETVFVTPTILSGGGDTVLKALLNKKYNGYQVTGNTNNAIRLVDDNLLTDKAGHYIIAIGEPDSTFRWQSSDRWNPRTNELVEEKIFKIEKLSSTFDSGILTNNESIIYGLVFITPEEYEQFFNGVRYVKIKDLDSQYVTQSV